VAVALASAVVAVFAIIASLLTAWSNLTSQREIADANRRAQRELQEHTLKEQERMALDARAAQKALQEQTLEFQKKLAQEAREAQFRLETHKQLLARRERYADELLEPLRTQVGWYRSVHWGLRWGDDSALQKWRNREAVDGGEVREISPSLMTHPRVESAFHLLRQAAGQLTESLNTAFAQWPPASEDVRAAGERLQVLLSAHRELEAAAERSIFDT